MKTGPATRNTTILDGTPIAHQVFKWFNFFFLLKIITTKNKPKQNNNYYNRTTLHVMGAKLAMARAPYTDLPRVTLLCFLASFGARVYKQRGSLSSENTLLLFHGLLNRQTQKINSNSSHDTIQADIFSTEVLFILPLSKLGIFF